MQDNTTQNVQYLIIGNKKIAEFMGANKSYFGDYMIFTIDNPQYTGKINHSDIHYDTDWNWIMPVIEKISNYHYPDFYTGDKPEEAHEYDDCAYPRTFGMRDEEGDYMVRINANGLVKSKSFIKAVWLAVIDFIDYYNALPPNP